MAAKTDLKVITLILQKLFVLEGAEEPEDEDFQAAKTVFDSRIEFLRDRGIAWWSNNQVPAEAVDPLAEYMTHWVSLSFETGQDYWGRSRQGFADLSELSSLADDSGEPIQVTYF